MVSVAKLSADLDVKTSRFEAGLARARARAKETQSVLDKFNVIGKKGFTSIGSGLDTLVGKFNGLKAGIAAVIGAAGLTALIRSQINAASAIKDMSERLQIGTDALQKYQFGAKLVGTSAETLETAITKLNGKIGDGSYKYKNAEEALTSISEAMRKAKTDAERSAIANDAFGVKLGAKMIPLLKDGAAGLKAMGDEAVRTGNVLSKDTIQAADKLGDTLDTLIGTMEKSFSQGFLDKLVGSSSDLKDVYSDPEFAKNIKNIGGLFGDLAEEALKLVSIIGMLIGKYQELSDLSKGSYGLDERFFDWASKNFDSPANQQKHQMKKQGIGSDFGQNVYGGGMLGAGLSAGKPAAQGGGDPKVTPFAFSGDTAKQTQDKIKAVLDGLKKETDALVVENSLYGQKASVIERARKQMEIQNKLAADGITLTKDQQAQVSKYLDLLEEQKQLQEDQQKYQETMQEFSDIVRNSFEQAIESGGSLSDVLQGLLKDIEKLVLKKMLLDPLFGDGSSGSTGFLTGILGNIGSAIFGHAPSMPSHATGQARVPYDMMARLHKGEQVITAQQANHGGGVELNVQVVNNNGSKVAATPKNGENGVDLMVLIDNAVAKNVSRQGSRTNDALNAQASRQIVRRG